jgi:quercetin dioxygenase-like cupin family protein
VSAGTWANGPGEHYPEHRHDYDKSIEVETGSITFFVGGAAYPLREGGRLELPAGTAHAATVGPDGVRCREAHLEPGTLRAVRALPKPAAAGAA